MKLQLTKDKAIDIRMPWEKTSATASSSPLMAGPAEMTGVALFEGDARGCPAVRLLRKKDGIHVIAAGFVPPPSADLPASWEEAKKDVTWQVPAAFQAPQAALAVTSPGMLVAQTTLEALTAAAPSGDAAKSPAKKKLGIKRNTEEKPAAPAPAKLEAPVPFTPFSREGMRSVVAPLGDEAFLLQASLPEFQVGWLATLLPEGKRPTVCSVQTMPAALLSTLRTQPEFQSAEGSAVVVFVARHAIYFAAYKQGALILFRECPGAVGHAEMFERVKRALEVEEELVASILEDTLIDPRPALEPFVRPILLQLRLSLDYLAQRHDLHVDRVFLLGLPAGAAYWSQLAQEMLGLAFLAPGVFDGLIFAKKNKNVPVDLAPAASQAFLPALGAALAAMEGA